MIGIQELEERIKKIELLPKQQKFLVNALYNENAKFLRYIGGFGSGKSFIGCLTGIYLSFMYPKNLGIISRSTLVDLKNTTWRTFFEVCDMLGLECDVHYKIDRHENKLTFENGSEIIFTGLDDIQKIKGMEPGWFYMDEVDEVNPEVFKVMQRRLRNKYTDRRIGFITSNSEGKNRTYQSFIAGADIPERYRHAYYTIRASSLENKHLPDDYIDNLLSFDEDYFKRYVLAEFNVFEGQIYDEFMEHIHIVDDFEVPESRDLAYGHDHGLSNPTAIIEGRMSNDGELYITREHYQAGKTAKHHANVLKERRKVVNAPLTGQPLVISDPSIFANTQLPTPERPFPWSVADEYMDNGVHPIRGNNQVLAGINRIKELLKLNKIYVFRSCKNTIHEIQNYKRAKNRQTNAKEAPVKRDDHLCDALRYMVMAKLPPTKKIKAPGQMSIAELVASDIAQYNNPKKYQENEYDFI